MNRPVDSTLLHVLRVKLVTDYPVQICACLDALDTEQIWWRPHEQANAIANLVLHLAGSNNFYLDHAIGGAPLSRDRDQEFSARRTHSKDDLRRHWNSSVAASERVLAALTPPRLTDSTERTGKPSTIAQILIHVSHHNAVHLGQIVWITKSLASGALDDIWMKPRTNASSGVAR